MGVAGPEQDGVSSGHSKGLGNAPKSGGAESGAEPAEKARRDPELAKVIDAWPTLPEAVQKGILAMVEAAKGD